MGVTEDLSKFITNISYTDFPPHTVQFAKELMLKYIASVVAGTREPVAPKITKYIRQLGGTPEASTIGGGFKAPAESVALLLGTLSHAAELEDDLVPGMVSTITVCSALLPLAERFKISGKDVIVSFVVGNEVQSRLLLTCHPRALDMGLAVIAYFGLLGAVSAAAKALSLNATETAMALSLAVSQAAGLAVQSGTMAHFLETGFASRAGVLAASLAKDGVDSQFDIFERRGGLLSLFGESGCDLSKTTENLGKPPYYLHKIWVKKYPCCLMTQRQIDALVSIVKEKKITYEQIERVDVEVNPADAAFCNRPTPKDRQDGRFSFQHTLSAVLLEGLVDLDTFLDEKLVDSRWVEARNKIKVIAVPEWSGPLLGGVTRVTVVTKDNRKLAKKLAQPSGAPESPLTTEQIVNLFRQYVRGVLSEPQIERTIEIVLDLENQKDILELMDILGASFLG